MPLESAEAREARRAREFARRALFRASRCNLRNMPVEFVADLLGTTPGTLEVAVEAGCLSGERGPDGALLFSRRDLLDFVSAPPPIVQAVRSEAAPEDPSAT